MQNWLRFKFFSFKSKRFNSNSTKTCRYVLLQNEVQKKKKILNAQTFNTIEESFKLHSLNRKPFFHLIYLSSGDGYKSE